MSAFNRRDFLRGLGAGALFLSAPEKILMGSILDGAFNKATAAQNGIDEKILINLFMYSGPPRWYFDLPLNPNGSDSIIDSGMTKNRFITENGNMRAVMDHHKVGNFYLPYLWKANIPTSDGGFAPMSNLAQSAIFIRGYDMVNDGHEQNRTKHNSPLPGSPSLSGIFADHSSKPFSAITSGENYQHKSAMGKSIVSAPPNGDPFTTMMSPFSLSSSKSFNRRQVMDDAIKNLHKNVSSFFGSKNSYASSLMGEKDSSIELFLRGSIGLKEKYQAIFNKYRSLELRAYSDMNLEGIDDSELLVRPGDLFRFDADSVIRADSTGGDFRSLFSNGVSAGAMAENFALVEYVVTENLSSSIMVSLGNLFNLNLNNFNYVDFNTAASKKGVNIFNFDSHNSGSHACLYLYSKFYSAFASCLYELTKVLESKNIYNNTIIQLSSEFNRSARVDGSGADHGYRGCGTSIYSGMFKSNDGPLVIGNITKNQTTDGYSGTWGVGAPVAEMGNRVLGIGNIMSTVTSLAGYETPTKNDAPFLKVNNGKIINLMGKPKNI